MSEDDVLMHETFESLRPGPIREAVDGPFREMHAQPASPDDNRAAGRVASAGGRCRRTRGGSF